MTTVAKDILIDYKEQGIRYGNETYLAIVRFVKGELKEDNSFDELRIVKVEENSFGEGIYHCLHNGYALVEGGNSPRIRLIGGFGENRDKVEQLGDIRPPNILEKMVNFIPNICLGHRNYSPLDQSEIPGERLIQVGSGKLSIYRDNAHLIKACKEAKELIGELDIYYKF